MDKKLIREAYIAYHSMNETQKRYNLMHLKTNDDKNTKIFLRWIKLYKL